MKTIFALLLLTVPFFGTTQNSWESVHSVDGVNISKQQVHCDLKRGYVQDWIVFKYENTNDHKITLIWDFQLWYDGECSTCDDPSGEYHMVLELQPGETIEGKCKIAEDARLYIFEKFDDPNTDMKTALTKFKFANLQVVKMN